MINCFSSPPAQLMANKKIKCQSFEDFGLLFVPGREEGGSRDNVKNVSGVSFSLPCTGMQCSAEDVK